MSRLNHLMLPVHNGLPKIHVWCNTCEPIDSHYYRPQWSWGKAMFLHVSVILFTGGSASVHAGIPPWQGDPHGKTDPMARQTPLARRPPFQGKGRPPNAVHAARYGERAGGIHPTGMQFLLTHFWSTYFLKYWWDLYLWPLLAMITCSVV